MKNKKYLKLALILTLSLPLAACGNNEKAFEEKPSQLTSEGAKETKENKEVAKDSKKTDEDNKKDSDDNDIYDLEFSYLPEGFEENFRDEKIDLITIEFTPAKNPAKKITIQVSNNEERMDELVEVPDDAEDIKIGENTGKYWDDGSFNYIFIKNADDLIYTRSTLEKEEAIKVVEGIK